MALVSVLACREARKNDRPIDTSGPVVSNSPFPDVKIDTSPLDGAPGITINIEEQGSRSSIHAPASVRFDCHGHRPIAIFLVWGSSGGEQVPVRWRADDSPIHAEIWFSTQGGRTIGPYEPRKFITSLTDKARLVLENASAGETYTFPLDHLRDHAQTLAECMGSKR